MKRRSLLSWSSSSNIASVHERTTGNSAGELGSHLTTAFPLVRRGIQWSHSRDCCAYKHTNEGARNWPQFHVTRWQLNSGTSFGWLRLSNSEILATNSGPTSTKLSTHHRLAFNTLPLALFDSGSTATTIVDGDAFLSPQDGGIHQINEGFCKHIYTSSVYCWAQNKFYEILPLESTECDRVH